MNYDNKVECLSVFKAFFDGKVSMNATYKPIFLKSLLDLGKYDLHGPNQHLAGSQWVKIEGNRIILDLNFTAIRMILYYLHMDYFDWKHSDNGNTIIVTETRKHIPENIRKSLSLYDLMGDNYMELRNVVNQECLDMLERMKIQDVPDLYELAGNHHIILEIDMIKCFKLNHGILDNIFNDILRAKLKRLNHEISNTIDGLFIIPIQLDERSILSERYMQSITAHNNFDRETLEQILKIENDPKLEPTEKVSLQKARIGQDKFRDKLIAEYPSCIITNIDQEELLIASHIKPWKNCSNMQRLDHYNGLLLSATYDKLFDLGFITFKTNGKLRISQRLKRINAKILQIKDEQQCHIPHIEKRTKYLEYHNIRIFR